MSILDRIGQEKPGKNGISDDRQCECGSQFSWLDIEDNRWCIVCDPIESVGQIKRRDVWDDGRWRPVDRWDHEPDNTHAQDLILWAHIRRQFPDMDGEPGTYCYYCLSRDLETKFQKVCCRRCGRWVKFV